MTSVIFERISWLFRSLTGILSRKRFSEFVRNTIQQSTRSDTTDTNLRGHLAVCDLPNECIVEIFQYLPQDDLFSCRDVCRKWRVLIDYNKSLWHTVHIGSFLEDEVTTHRAGNLCPSLVQTKFDAKSRSHRYPALVPFLRQRAIFVKHLIICLSPSGFSTQVLKSIRDFFQSCLPKRLKSLSLYCITTTQTSNLSEFESGKNTIFINEILKYISECPNKIESLDVDLPWNAENVRLIRDLRCLQNLEIHSCPYVQHIAKWHIQDLLATLGQLQKFKVVNTGIPKVFERFDINSSSLTQVDISNCVNFLIVSMKCPQLMTFKAHDVKYYRTVYFCDVLPCVKQILFAGCPKLKYINGKPVSATEEIQKMEFCCCKKCANI